MISAYMTVDQMTAIANVAIESAHLDLTLEHMIWVLCGFTESKGRIFTDDKQTGAKIKLAVELIDHRFKGKPPPEFKAMFDNIADLMKKRNTLIHGEWIPSAMGKNGKSTLADIFTPGNRAAINRKRNKENRSVHANEALKIAKLIEKNHELLRRLYYDHCRTPKRLLRSPRIVSFPGKSPQQLLEEIRNLHRSA
jgi:hypothetical protein